MPQVKKKSPQVKKKSPDQFVAQSPVGEGLIGVFEHKLAGGALRLVKIDGEPQKLSNLGNSEAKVSETIGSGIFGIISENPGFIEAEINNLLINENEVPQSYYDLQQRIAHEHGYGRVEITDELKREAVKTLRADQAESLRQWSDYLRGDENGHVYPDWFKVYVWESLKKMGAFDKERGKFKKRTKSTVASWPELNAEALAYVWDNVSEGVIKGNGVDDEKLAKFLESGNFAKLYAHAMHDLAAGGITPEMRENDEGVNAGGELTVKDILFLKFSGSIEGFGWNGDPRVRELVSGMTVDEAINSVLSLGTQEEIADLVSRMTPGGIAFYLEELLDAGANVEHIVSHITPNGIASHLKELLDAGANINIADLVSHITPNGIASHLKELLDAGANIEHIVSHMTPDGIAFRVKELLDAGANVDHIVSLMDVDDIAFHLKKLLDAGANVDHIVSRMTPKDIAFHLKELLDAGANIEHIVSHMTPDVIAFHVIELLDAGANVDHIVSHMTPDGIAFHLKELRKAGANINIADLVSRMTPVSIAFHLKKLLDAGANVDHIVSLMDAYDIIHKRHYLMKAGADRSKLGL